MTGGDTSPEGTTEFRMPILGADMERGTLLEWLVRPGDTVQRGQVVAVVDTAKAAIEVECFTDGVVDELLVDPGTEVPVGTVLARLRSAVPAGDAAAHPGPAETAAAHPGPAETAAAHPGPPAVSSPVVRHLAERLHVDLAGVVGTGQGGRITRKDVERAGRRPQTRDGHLSASPRARRLAAERGIDLAVLGGTGPGGAITAGDVEKATTSRTDEVTELAAAAPPAAAGPRVFDAAEPSQQPSPTPTAADRLRAMREAVGDLMSRSKREIPHFYLSSTIDMSRAMAWLHEANLHRPVSERLLPAALLLKAAARATREVPDVNGYVIDGHVQRADHVHLGVAVNLRGGGLVAPAVHDADTLALADLMTALTGVVGRARAGRLTRTEMTEATITVTNLGDLGVESVFGVIVPPQIVLVGFGRVAERPWAENGMVGVRPAVVATLSADHRALDGHRAGLYLTAVDTLLQQPEDL